MPEGDRRIAVCAVTGEAPVVTEEHSQDTGRLPDSGSPEIILEFAEILRRVYEARVQGENDRARAAYRMEYERLLRQVMQETGWNVERSAEAASHLIAAFRIELEARRLQQLERHLAWARGAVENLLAWWNASYWNSANRPGDDTETGAG
jgi:hypothetical protein